jgi:RNA polymerase sigma-70 factor (ECF subfamily)
MPNSDAMNDVPTHAAFLLTQARRLCRNEADARDLVQDTCLHALEALRRSDSPPDNLRAWLVVILRNHFFSVIRQQRVRATAHAEIASQPSVEVGHVDGGLLYDRIARAWTQLPSRSQTIAQQCLIDGDSQEDVSRRLGMTPGGVAASIHRTRAALRQSVFGMSAD